MQEINESIEVVVVFRRDKAFPFKFWWQGREIEIKKVNLSYSSWEGRVKVYYFAVSDNANYFKLMFNSDSLNWTLLEVNTE